MPRRLGQQRLVVGDPAVVGDLHGTLSVAAVVHHHYVADGLAVVDVRPQQRQQAAVREDDLILGVVGDVDELVSKQTDVERVQHPPGAGRREVQLQMARVVPGEGRDPAVGRNAEGVQHGAEPAGAVGPLAVGDALDALRPGGRQALGGPQRLRSAEDAAERQR
jgi:hypothetical protein